MRCGRRRGDGARGDGSGHGSRRTRAAPPQRPGRPSTDVRPPGGGDGLPVRREAGRRSSPARRDAASRAPARSPLRGRHGSPGSGAVAYLRRRPRPRTGVRRGAVPRGPTPRQPLHARAGVVRPGGGAGRPRPGPGDRGVPAGREPGRIRRQHLRGGDRPGRSGLAAGAIRRAEPRPAPVPLDHRSLAPDGGVAPPVDDAAQSRPAVPAHRELGERRRPGGGDSGERHGHAGVRGGRRPHAGRRRPARGDVGVTRMGGRARPRGGHVRGRDGDLRRRRHRPGDLSYDTGTSRVPSADIRARLVTHAEGMPRDRSAPGRRPGARPAGPRRRGRCRPAAGRPARAMPPPRRRPPAPVPHSAAPRYATG